MSRADQDRDEVLAVLESFMKQHKSEYRLLSLGVFGSYARGESRPGSDVDIFFETQSPNLFRTAKMQAELEQLLERKVDVVRLRDRMNPRLKRRIMEDARYV